MYFTKLACLLWTLIDIFDLFRINHNETKTDKYIFSLLSFDRVGKRLPKKITKGTERLREEKEGMPLKNGAQTLGLF